jgi:carbon monoxide dehydrogenase subunit G
MQMTGSQRIAAPRQKVWEGLNDADVLRRSIPGCQSLEREGTDRLKATIEIKIGPIGARFAGVVTLSDIDPPNGYTLSGSGQAGATGSAKGSAKVRLADDKDSTILTYEVNAEVGGRLAQLGGPIIDATAKQLAAKFFRQFGSVITGTPSPATKVSANEAIATTSPMRSGSPVAWILAVALAALVGFLLGRGSNSDWIVASVGLLIVAVGFLAFVAGRRSGPPGIADMGSKS